MTLLPQSKRSLLTGCTLLALAVLIGAFGAHGLKAIVTPEKLVTFETGVRYHFYHGFGLMILGLCQMHFPLQKMNVTFYSFVLGIILFSFNCYFYVLSDLKVFAMIVPLGGLLFVVGWLSFFYKILKPS